MLNLPLTTSLQQRCAFNLQQIRSSHPKLDTTDNCPFCAGAGWAALISSHKADSVDVGSGSGASAASSSSSSSSAWTPSSDYLSVRSLARSIGRVVTRPMGEPQSPKKMKTRSSEAASHDQPVAKIEEKQTEEVVQVAGQAVCVIHPRIMITATHVCFDRSKQCSIQLLYTPLDGSKAYFYTASLIRYSEVMDVSVLLIDSENSPFEPVDIVPSDSPLFKQSLVIAMACFPYAYEADLTANSETDESSPGLSQLLKKPHLFWGSIADTTPHTKLSRKFHTAHFIHPSLAICSGSGVFSSKLSSTGKPQLLCMHSRVLSQIVEPYTALAVREIGEFDGAQSTSPDRSRTSDAKSRAVADHDSQTKQASSENTTVTSQVEHKSSPSVGVIVATVLNHAQHPAWSCDALRAAVPPEPIYYVNLTASLAACLRREARLNARPQPVEPSPQQSSSSDKLFPIRSDQLYD